MEVFPFLLLLLSVRVRVASAYFEVSTTETALTVRVLRDSATATVSFPALLMEVPACLFDSKIDQVTVCSGLLVPVTVAEKVWDLPFWTVALVGLIDTLTVGTVEPPGASVLALQAAIENPIITAARAIMLIKSLALNLNTFLILISLKSL
jgi:hypothetical protein